MKGTNQIIGTEDLSRIATLSVLYVSASFFSLAAFIGGTVFITVAIILVPVIAWMLRQQFAIVASIISANSTSVI